MASLREKIELWFETLTRLIYKNRKKTLLIMLVIIAAIVSNLRFITFDTSTEGFLHKTDPEITRYNGFRDQFGRDEMIVIALNPKNVFDIGFLKKLKSFHKELENNVPHLDDITSLINTRNTRGEADRLIVEDLLENFPQNEEEMAELKKRVFSNPLYKNTVISEDGSFTTVLLKTNSLSATGPKEDALSGFEEEENGAAPKKEPIYLTDEENKEVIAAVKNISDKYNSPDFPLYIAGSPVVTDTIKSSIQADMKKFVRLVVLTIAIILFALFRRKSGVLMPLIVIIASFLSTFGFMALFGAAIKVPTVIIPSFLIAVGVGDSVHVLALFFRKFDRDGDKEEAIVYAMGHSGLPIAMTSLTTAAGLASFAGAQIAPIADLGIYSALGVMLALLYTIILLPALIAALPLSRKVSRSLDENNHSKFDRVLTAVADFATGYPKSIVTAGFAMIFVGLFFASQLRFTHNPLEWLPKTIDVRKATEKIDSNLKGSTTLEVIIDSGKENGLHEPKLLNAIESAKKTIGEMTYNKVFVGKTITITDIVKETNRALNENRDEFYSIPQNKPLIAQELLLFENSGSDDLEDMVDSQFRKARFTVKLPWSDAIDYGIFSPMIESEFKKAIGDQAEITVTGIVSLIGRTLKATIFSAAESYLIAFLVITAMMVLLIGEIRVGLLSMIPNLMPIIFILGIMKVAGIPLDMFTMLIGSIAIGLAVDDTVHFMHNFKKYYHDSKNAQEAVRHTFRTAGRAMVVTTIVLSSGFFIYMFSFMHNIFNFGLLTGLTIILALLADFLLAPALMKLITDRDKRYAKDY